MNPKGWKYAPIYTSAEAANQVADKMAERNRLDNKWFRS